MENINGSQIQVTEGAKDLGAQTTKPDEILVINPKDIRMDDDSSSSHSLSGDGVSD